MPFGTARLKKYGFLAARAGYSCGLVLLIFLFGSKALQNAIAEGETRTISLHHIHTDEDITITYKRNGQYDEAALEKLNWFLRDWRRGEQTRMDPRLIDLVWEVQRETGAKEPIWVVCGYRSPETNAMLRRRSSGVARFSQHMLGRAMDFYIPGVPLEELRVLGLRLQRGGVGFYPTSGSPFVHMDTGSIRMWPRMTREQLSRVFPDGRTVHIPSDGRPLSGYELALADIKKHGDNPSDTSLEAARGAGVDVGSTIASTTRPVTNLFTRLFRPSRDEDEDADTASTTAATSAPTRLQRRTQERAAVARVETDESMTVPKPMRTAAVVAQPPALRASESTGTAAGSANQIIASRGYWDGVNAAVAPRPDGQAADALDAVARPRSEIRTADASGSVSPLLQAAEDRVPPQLALAYAAQVGTETPSPITTSTPIGGSSLRAAVVPERPQPPYATTIAVKRTGNLPASPLFSAPSATSSAAGRGASLDSPWLRAVMLSPSVRDYLTTLVLGPQNFRALATLMRKPASSVMITFSTQPNIGLTHDHFSGSAIIFVSTVTYPPSTHTALLQ